MTGTARTAARGARRAEAPGAVRWTAAPDPEDRRRLDAWRAAVGPPVVVRPGSPQPAGAAEDWPVLVAWNARLGVPGIERLVRDLRAGRWTGGEPVRHFVFLLQEVHRTGAAVPRAGGRGPRRIRPRTAPGAPCDIEDLARRLELHLFYVPSMRNGRPRRGLAAEDRGNAILATLPLADLAAIELPFEAQRRVAVAATVPLPAPDGGRWDLRVVSVHLDHRSRAARLAASAGRGRLRQARALVAGAGAGTPIALGGDFNTWADARRERTIAYLLERFPATPAGDGRPTFHAGPLRRRLDRFFFRLPTGVCAHVRRLDDRYGSDHYPLLATLAPTPEVAAPVPPPASWTGAGPDPGAVPGRTVP